MILIEEEGCVSSRTMTSFPFGQTPKLQRWAEYRETCPDTTHDLVIFQDRCEVDWLAGKKVTLKGSTHESEFSTVPQPGPIVIVDRATRTPSIESLGGFAPVLDLAAISQPIHLEEGPVVECERIGPLNSVIIYANALPEMPHRHDVSEWQSLSRSDVSPERPSDRLGQCHLRRRHGYASCCQILAPNSYRVCPGARQNRSF
jgi:hypothetical protein